MESPQVLQVSELTQAIKELLETPMLTNIAVEGEISNFKHHVSGHMYFTLKDAKSRIKCVMFRGRNARLGFRPGNGQTVVAVGSVSVYEANGEYQLYVEQMFAQGLGALHAAYQELKQRLEKEGLFAQERKRQLPFLPRTVGVVTSATGAALRDILSVLQRRYPASSVLLVPAQVQGEAAAATLIRALQLCASQDDVDVIIIGRGGGSIEELWAFNDEALARAIAACPKPVIAAVGHETDFTIVDFAADLRAPTPSAAAEMAVPDYYALQGDLNRLREGLIHGYRQRLQYGRQLVGQYKTRPVLSNPLRVLDQKRQRVDDWLLRLMQARQHQHRQRVYHLESLKQRPSLAAPSNMLRYLRGRLEQDGAVLIRNHTQNLAMRRSGFAKYVSQLDSLSPLAVLGRGYAVAQRQTGDVVRRWDEVAIGESLLVILQRGYLTCSVEKGEEHGKYDL